MINKFKYSYISYENDTPWNEDPVVDLSLSYSSYNMDYNFNSNEQLSKNKGFIKSLLENNKKVILYSQPWNQHISNQKLFRISNLSEAIKKIKMI